MTFAFVHADPLGRVLLGLAAVLLLAKLGGYAAERAGQPSVLGELVVGVVLGNLGIVGAGSLDWIKGDATLGLLANLGAVVLLFEVGLESTLRDMVKVGPRSLLVALLGVVAPWLLGWWVGAMLLPDRSVYVHIFLGATLTATSVGITARVLKDLGRGQTPEARIILGAAVIDDVLGLVILALVGSVIAAANAGHALSFKSAGLVLTEAGVFLFGALAIGTLASPRIFRFASRLPGPGTLLTIALACCFALASLASAIGLAAIVGAYAAGLILEETHYRDFTMRGERRLEELVHPISTLLVPLFFVLMGMRVDLGAFAHPGALGLAALLAVAAITGKQACALGAIGSTLDGITIGIGMIPRGEVGLIFANIGLGLVVHGERIVDDQIYSAVLIAVMTTTVVTPPALKWRMGRATRRMARASISVEHFPSPGVSGTDAILHIPPAPDAIARTRPEIPPEELRVRRGAVARVEHVEGRDRPRARRAWLPALRPPWHGQDDAGPRAGDGAQLREP